MLCLKPCPLNCHTSCRRLNFKLLGQFGQPVHPIEELPIFTISRSDQIKTAREFTCYGTRSEMIRSEFLLFGGEGGGAKFSDNHLCRSSAATTGARTITSVFKPSTTVLPLCYTRSTSVLQPCYLCTTAVLPLYYSRTSSVLHA